MNNDLELKECYTFQPHDPNVYNGWELTKALEFIREFEKRLWNIDHHVGITGGVLFKGESTKDLDLIVYPRNKKEGYVAPILEIIERLPLKVISFYQCTNNSSARYRDKKTVVACTLENTLRVDLFFLS